MAYQVVWSPRAVDDVRAIAAHIAEDYRRLREVGGSEDRGEHAEAGHLPDVWAGSTGVR